MFNMLKITHAIILYQSKRTVITCVFNYKFDICDTTFDLCIRRVWIWCRIFEKGRYQLEYSYFNLSSVLVVIAEAYWLH